MVWNQRYPRRGGCSNGMERPQDFPPTRSASLPRQIAERLTCGALLAPHDLLKGVDEAGPVVVARKLGWDGA